MKREIIFEAPETEEYRIVCRFGYDDDIPYAWWTFIQKKVYYKKFIFFGETKWKWGEIHRCWWNKEFKTMDELKKSAYKFYDEKILSYPRIPRIIKQAMEL